VLLLVLELALELVQEQVLELVQQPFVGLLALLLLLMLGNSS
jgi:hypothetical protein